jgi:hypothetical protein
MIVFSDTPSLREVCHLGDGAPRSYLLVRHDREPFICRCQDATLHGDPAFEMIKGLVQCPGGLDLPIDAIDVSARVAEDLQVTLASQRPCPSRRVPAEARVSAPHGRPPRSR